MNIEEKTPLHASVFAVVCLCRTVHKWGNSGMITECQQPTADSVCYFLGQKNMRVC